MTTRIQQIWGNVLIGALLFQSVTVWSAPPVSTRLLDALAVEEVALASLFERDSLLEAADYDAGSLIAFAQEEIALEIYPGLLRGPQATIAGRAGNALDQSLLLATLLKDAGYEAQIATSDLDQNQIDRLLTCMVDTARDPLTAPVASPWLQKLRAQAAKHVRVDTDIRQHSAAMGQRLTEALPERALKEASAAMQDQLNRSAARYYWVRYQTDGGPAWKAAHPACAAAAQWNLSAKTIYADQVPDQALQQIALSVHVTDSQGESHRVAGPWTRPAANLFERDLTLEVVSDGSLIPDNLASAATLTAGSRYFYIRLNGQTLPNSSIFDRQGRLLPMDAAEGLNSIFATVAGATQEAADALSELGRKTEESRKAPKLLQKVWVEISSMVPGAERASTTHRALFELRNVPESQDPAQALALALVQRWNLAVDTTVPDPLWLQLKKNRALQQAFINHEQLGQLIAKADQDSSIDDDELKDAAIRLTADPALARLTQLRANFALFDPGRPVLQYLHQPNVSAVRTGLRVQGEALRLYEMTDIIDNRALGFRKTGTGWKPAPEANLLRGIWQTYAEHLDLTPAADATAQSSAWDQLQQVSRWERATAPQADGHWALSGVNASPQQGWWQIDSQTGSAIGMADLGAGAGGAAMTEEALMGWIALGISGAFFVVGTAVCSSGGGSFSCCVYTNGALALGGWALSYLIGFAAIAYGVGWGIGVASSVAIDLGASQLSYRCGSYRS